MSFKKFAFLKAAAIYTIGAFFVQGINFLMVPVFAGLMSSDSFGRVSSYENWISIVSVIIGLQTAGSITNAYTDFGEKNITKYTGTVSLLGIISTLGSIAVLYLFRTPLEDLFELGFLELFIGTIQCLFAYYVALLLNMYRVLNRATSYLILTAINTLTTVVFSAVLLLVGITDDYIARIIGMFVASLLSGGIAVLYIFKQGKTEWNFNYIKYAIVLCIPLIFHSFAGTILSKTDQMMLLKMTTSSEMGIYSYGNKLGHVVYVAYTAINTAFIPWYYQKKKNSEKESIVHLINAYSWGFGIICGIGIMFVPEIIFLISPDEYYDAIYTTPLIMLSYYYHLLYTFPSNDEFYNKKTFYIAFGTVVSGLVNIVLNAFMIPKFGGTGAAIATCISSGVLLIMHLFIAIKIVGDFEMRAWPLIGKMLALAVLMPLYYYFIDSFFIRGTISLMLLIFMFVLLVRFKRRWNHTLSA